MSYHITIVFVKCSLYSNLDLICLFLNYKFMLWVMRRFFLAPKTNVKTDG